LAQAGIAWFEDCLKRLTWAEADRNSQPLTVNGTVRPNVGGAAAPAQAHDPNGARYQRAASGKNPYRLLIQAAPDLIGKTVTMTYGPKGRPRLTFSAVLREKGVEFQNVVSSPSTAAQRAMAIAGRQNPAANGWDWWHMETGETLDEVYKARVKAS